MRPVPVSALMDPPTHTRAPARMYPHTHGLITPDSCLQAGDLDHDWRHRPAGRLQGPSADAALAASARAGVHRHAAAARELHVRAAVRLGKVRRELHCGLLLQDLLWLHGRAPVRRCINTGLKVRTLV